MVEYILREATFIRDLVTIACKNCFERVPAGRNQHMNYYCIDAFYNMDNATRISVQSSWLYLDLASSRFRAQRIRLAVVASYAEDITNHDA